MSRTKPSAPCKRSFAEAAMWLNTPSCPCCCGAPPRQAVPERLAAVVVARSGLRGFLVRALRGYGRDSSIVYSFAQRFGVGRVGGHAGRRGRPVVAVARGPPAKAMVSRQ